MSDEVREKMREHSRKAAETMRRKYGNDYFARIGKSGNAKRKEETPTMEPIPDRSEQLSDLQDQFKIETNLGVFDPRPKVCTACLQPARRLIGIWRLDERTLQALAGMISADAMWCEQCLARFVSGEHIAPILAVALATSCSQPEE